MSKKIWNWRQALHYMDFLQSKIEESAYSHKTIKFTPDDYDMVKDTFNMFRDNYKLWNSRIEEWE